MSLYWNEIFVKALSHTKPKQIATNPQAQWVMGMRISQCKSNFLKDFLQQHELVFPPPLLLLFPLFEWYGDMLCYAMPYILHIMSVYWIGMVMVWYELSTIWIVDTLYVLNRDRRQCVECLWRIFYGIIFHRNKSSLLFELFLFLLLVANKKRNECK